ncbi:hypothetical protein BDY19DRAFT_994554 [Irpex rosettiformis]|uniref:Uncharacterized protein n=1 Tax=Irpex rosettiformis TaxID=378272 RepID=A0ACB8U1E9_9APHY|nr:hypothetical protein BDY19DRAFT_994554 [Irpex rosettiformis]
MRATGSFVLLFALLQLANAVTVYLYPQPPNVVVPGQLDARRANFAIAKHLNLEKFESLGNDVILDNENNGGLIGSGARDGLLIAMSEEDAENVLPYGLKPTFDLPSPSVDSLAPLVRGYVHRATQVYTTVASSDSLSPLSSHQAAKLLDIFSTPTEANQAFLTSASALVDYLDNLSEETSDSVAEKFGAFELNGLGALAEQYGEDSEQYKTAVSLLRAILESTLSRPDLHLALITYQTSSSDNTPFYKRQDDQPQSPLPIPHPAEPIGSVSTCFETAGVCGNQTDSCSGHGECVSASKAGRTCFVCACAASTNEKGQKEEWAGEACERKDVSGPFVLLTGTTIGLILLVAGSVALLGAIGSTPLPSTLTGGVASSKRE